MTNYLFLIIAIIMEVIATSALKAADGFTRPLPTAITLTGYAIAFWMLSLTMRTVPIGIAYAIWSGLGTVLVTLVAIWVYGQKPDAVALLGITLIVAGVLLITLFSKMSSH